MVRLTRKVFADLAIWMIGFGLLMGTVFPFFVAAMGVPSSLVLTWWFFAACISAGIVVGAVNIGIARVVIGSRLRVLSQRMGMVETNLRDLARNGDLEKCTPQECFVEIDSEDELGESALAFNHLVEALTFAHQTEAAVRGFIEVLASQLELELLTNQALEQLIQHTGASAGAILVETDGELHVSASYGIKSPKKLAVNDHVRRALRVETRQVVSVPEDVVVQGVLADFRPREVIVAPLCYKHVPLGVLVLASVGSFSGEVRTRVDLFCQSLSLALNNALAHDRLQRLAAIDPLTGVYNRRFGMARLHEEFGRAVRQSIPLGVLMFDIDHFKGVNDTYGHLFGDRVLSRVGKLSRSVTREGDIIIRYGGEEFLAVLPAASREDVRDVGERLRRMVAEASVKDGDQSISVTISVGGTSYPEIDVEGEQELVKLADEALYSAKESGRNRVIVH
ncbi:MAG: sensor domain-containing diguanylate cyclase [Desulfomonile sp.]|nr:sensor domain-containing diguanylate cyclase [Desulfomonile sp.]